MFAEHPRAAAVDSMSLVNRALVSDRVESERVRRVPCMIAAPGMMLNAVPAWIVVIERTTESVGLVDLETMDWALLTI